MADAKISELTGYTPAVDTDEVPIVDKTSGITKKITWANIKATLKTYFDGLYTSVVKASSAEVDTGTDDAKFATALAIKDSHNVPSVVPGTDGNVLTSNGTDWISEAPTGGGGAASVVNSEAVSGTKDGSNTSFTLANTPVAGSVLLYLNGQRLTVTGDYTISGTGITMVVAPQSTDILLADYLISSGTYSVGSASWVSNEVPSGTINSSNVDFTLVSAPVTGTLALYRDGQLLKGGGADYTLTTAAIAFVTAPVTGSVLLAFYQSAASTAGNADLLDGLHAPSAASTAIVGTTDTQTLTNKTLTSPLFQGSVDGWISANETWAYASATTITVPSGAVSKYQKGDKIKYTAGGVVHYHYIIIVADTLLTTVGDAVHNDTMTLNYYSHQENPMGFPDWFTYTPTITWTAGTAPSGSPTKQEKFKISGKSCTISIFNISYTAGATVTAASVGLPVAAASNSAAWGWIGVFNTWTNSYCYVGTGSPTADILCTSVSASAISVFTTYPI